MATATITAPVERTVTLVMTETEAQTIRTILGHSFYTNDAGLGGVFEALEKVTHLEESPAFVLAAGTY